MPKDLDLVSESSFNDMPLEEAIRGSIRDLQAALNNIQLGLLTLIDHDEISVEEYGPTYSCVLDLIELAKELKQICLSFKPDGFKLKDFKPQGLEAPSNLPPQ